MGNDDEVKALRGVIAANEQQSMLMRLESKVKLPDHTFALADEQKLMPSVHGVCNIDGGSFGDHKGVKHHGPTFITIRGGRHDSTTTFDHGNDTSAMYNEPEC